MLWQALFRQVSEKIPDCVALENERAILLIDSQTQLLHHVAKDERQTCCYPISTAAKGLGNQVDSYQTPFGVHQINQKIGGDQPRGMVFKGRQPTGQIRDGTEVTLLDEITSRILWLEGLEPSVNQGHDCDSYQRYIYIHGTSDEARIGQAVSIGCIRMNNDDVMRLYGAVDVHDLVVIR